MVGASRSFASLRMTALFVLAVTAACTFDQQAVAVTKSEVVVHAVLDPSAQVQQVLVEQSLTGTINIDEQIRYDTLDPINTGGGVPIAGAFVAIQGPDGQLVGIEKKYSGKPFSYGTGRYEIAAGLGKTPIRAGAKYTLTVRTPSGDVVTGTTVVPNAAAVNTTARVDPFDRERDTLRLKWNVAPLARTYALRVESPFGAFLLFSDTAHLELPGTLRNFFADQLQRVFIPGFQQIATVSAVDTNFFDYYRSRNDPFTGSGIINRLTGGIGLFGSAVTVLSRNAVVTQPTTEPTFEGVYELVTAPTAPTKLVDVFRLYVESKNGDQASLSGNYTRNRTSTQRDAIAGTRDGALIQLDFLQNQDLKSRLTRFIGTRIADSLVGGYAGAAGRVVFKRQ